MASRVSIGLHDKHFADEQRLAMELGLISIHDRVVLPYETTIRAIEHVERSSTRSDENGVTDDRR